MRDPEHARLMLGLARRDLKALAGMTDMQDFEDPIVLVDTLIWVQRRVCSFPGRSKPAGAPARQRETASPVLHSTAFCGG